jgi:hypothetical protein
VLPVADGSSVVIVADVIVALAVAVASSLVVDVGEESLLLALVLETEVPDALVVGPGGLSSSSDDACDVALSVSAPGDPGSMPA